MVRHFRSTFGCGAAYYIVIKEERPIKVITVKMRLGVECNFAIFGSIYLHLSSSVFKTVSLFYLLSICLSQVDMMYNKFT